MQIRVPKLSAPTAMTSSFHISPSHTWASISSVPKPSTNHWKHLTHFALFTFHLLSVLDSIVLLFSSNQRCLPKNLALFDIHALDLAFSIIVSTSLFTSQCTVDAVIRAHQCLAHSSLDQQHSSASFRLKPLAPSPCIPRAIDLKQATHSTRRPECKL